MNRIRYYLEIHDDNDNGRTIRVPLYEARDNRGKEFANELDVYIFAEYCLNQVGLSWLEHRWRVNIHEYA